MNKPADLPLQAGANFYNEHGADEWTDAVVASMKLGGVDNMFFVSGTELAYYQEAVVKAEVKGWQPGLVPALVPVSARGSEPPPGPMAGVPEQSRREQGRWWASQVVERSRP